MKKRIKDRKTSRHGQGLLRTMLAAALLALGFQACNSDSDSATGGPGGGSGAAADGKLWTLGSTDFRVEEGISILDLATGETDTVLPLSRPALEIAITTRYAWVTLDRNYLVRIDRGDYRMDSIGINPPGDTSEATGKLAADDNSVWVATGNSARIVHVDPAAATVVKAFQASTVNNQIAGIQLHGGFAWALIDNGFSLAKIDPARDTVVARVLLGEDPANPDGPRAAKYGYGEFAIAGGKALVYDAYKKKLIRVDLSVPAVDTVFKPAWIAGITRAPLLPFDGTVLVTMEDSLKMRRIDLGTLLPRGDIPLARKVDDIAIRSDGLLAIEFTGGGLGRLGLARAGALDTLPGLLGPFENSGMAFPAVP